MVCLWIRVQQLGRWRRHTYIYIIHINIYIYYIYTLVLATYLLLLLLLPLGGLERGGAEAVEADTGEVLLAVLPLEVVALLLHMVYM